MTSEIAVKCVSLTKSYGQGEEAVPALRGIDLEVKAGEMMMLVGPSGCGKTTLISIVASIMDYDEGVCEVLGHDVKRMSQSERVSFRRDNIGFVFQAYNLLPPLTAAENVAVPLIIAGMNHTKATKIAAEALAKVGLGDKIKTKPGNLSGGQQQRVAIARALVHNPRLIVCDEPTSALDHETGGKIMNIMRDIAMNEDRTLLIVTHDNRIFEYADRIAHMDDGRITKVI